MGIPLWIGVDSNPDTKMISLKLRISDDLNCYADALWGVTGIAC